MFMFVWSMVAACICLSILLSVYSKVIPALRYQMVRERAKQCRRSLMITANTLLFVKCVGRKLLGLTCVCGWMDNIGMSFSIPMDMFLNSAVLPRPEISPPLGRKVTILRGSRGIAGKLCCARSAWHSLAGDIQGNPAAFMASFSPRSKRTRGRASLSWSARGTHTA